MHSNTILAFGAAFASLANAVPLLQARNTKHLADLLGRSVHCSDFDKIPLSSNSSVVSPDSPSWDVDTHRWSNWSAPTFDVAILPATENDVANTLKFLTGCNLSFLATSGGHGSAVTLSSVKNGVDINLANLNNITYNADDETITIGAGVHYRDVWTAAYGAGRELALPSSCTGVGGTTVGGGHSFAQGKYGLAIDEMVSMRVALWDGTILNLSATENPDLFWAMRGAGHNFGVVLEFTLKTWPQTNGGLYYNVDMSFTDDSLEGVLSVMNDIIPTQEADLGLDFVMFTNVTTNLPQLYLGLVYFGDAAKGKKYADRFATSKKAGIERTLFNGTMVRWDQLSDNAVGGFISVACSTSTSGEVDMSNLYVDVYTSKLKQFDIPLTRKIYDSYKSFTKQYPVASRSTVLWEVFSQKAVRAQDPSLTAYGNRGVGNILVLIQGTFTDFSLGSTIDKWGKGWRDQLMKHSGYPQQNVYLNYAHGDESLEAMYGYEPWRLERLRKLKIKYDPRGFFNHFNSVFGYKTWGA